MLRKTIFFNFAYGCILSCFVCFFSYGESVKTQFTIAINQTSYPYHYVDEHQQPQGMMVELWRLWAQKQGVAVEFIADNWQQTISQVANGEIDIHAGLSVNAKRQANLGFTQAFFHHKRHLFIHRSITHIRQVEGLKPFTVGVVAGSSHEATLQKQYPFLTLKRFNNRYELYQAAVNEEILVIAAVEKLSKNFSQYQTLNNNYPAFARIAVDSNDFAAAVTKKNTELLDFIQQGLDKISQSERSAIERKWLGVDKADNIVSLSYSNHLSPFSNTSVNGAAQGFFIDLFRLWSKYSAINIEFQLDDSPQLTLLSQQSIDLHIADIMMLDNEQLNLGPEIYRLNYGLFIKGDTQQYQHISTIKNQRIGLIGDKGFIRDLTNNTVSNKITTFTNYRHMLSAAERGEIDIVAGQQDLLEHYLLESNLQSTFSYYPSYRFSRPVHVLLSEKNDELRKLIQEGFSEIPLNLLVELEKKWQLDKSSGYFKQQQEKLTLSEQEAKWLQQKGVVTFGITKNWHPIEFVDQYGEYKGINPDIFAIMEQRLNTKFTYKVYDSFDELYQALLIGKVDAVGSVMHTPERETQVLFTKSYWSMPWVIIHPREQGNELELADFKGKALAITKGYYMISEIRQKFPTITLKLVNSSEEGLAAVQKNMVDGFIDNLSSGAELLKRESLISLGMSVLDEVDKNGNHIAINKQLPMLADILRKAVLGINEQDSQKIYEKWFDISIETGLDKNVVIRVAAQVGALIFIVIILIMVWNRRLYREIKNRKRLEQQMKYMATHDDLTGLANRILLKDRLNKAITFHQRKNLKIAVLFIDLDGFKNINDTYGHDVGDELLIEVAGRLKGCVRESDTVVRFGGDEFVLLLKGLNAESEASLIADKVLKVIQQPINLSAAEAHIGCSIGIAMYPHDGNTDNDLLKVADSLMYKVKATGKNHYVFNSDSQE